MVYNPFEYMEVIRPGLYKECLTCPRVDERVQYENSNPDKLVFSDDFKAEKLEVACTVEEGPVTRIYMDVWFEGYFTHNNVQRKKRREGRLKEVHVCPHFGDQKL